VPYLVIIMRTWNPIHNYTSCLENSWLQCLSVDHNINPMFSYSNSSQSVINVVRAFSVLFYHLISLWYCFFVRSITSLVFLIISIFLYASLFSE
jgi:hypothetical protein